MKILLVDFCTESLKFIDLVNLVSVHWKQIHALIIDLVVSVSVQWKRLSTNNEPPPPRAYHSMTCIGLRYLLFGGFDGKTTFGDIWWLVPEGI